MLIKVAGIFLGSLLLINHGYGQLCQGSLGDPIINITFGHGANPGGPLSAATTSYQYISTDCPGDGFYTVRNNTTSCFGNTWHSVNIDHTGDSSGYFMLVNASFLPGAFYLDTVKGLCGNTTYEFAAWIMNVLLPSACSNAGIQPNLTFSIEKTDGTLLQSYNSNNIPPSSTPKWNQYGFFFTTPPSVSDIVVRIVNNAPGGCGNDLALDDITFRSCGPQITGTIDGQSITSESFCEGSQRSFLLNCTTTGGFTNPAFQWQSLNAANGVWTDIPTAGSNTFLTTFPQTTPPGIYQFRSAIAQPGNINSLQCRVYSQPFIFTINANPVTATTNNSPVCEGNSLILSATGGSQYQWTGPGGFTATGSPLTLGNALMGQAGTYYVTVTNTAGCIHKDSVMVVVNPVPVATTTFASATICSGDSVQLTAGGGLTYQWSPPKGLSAVNIYNPRASPAATTGYSVIVSNQFFCKDTAVINVIINPKPIVDAGPDKIIFKGQSVQLSGMVNSPGNFAWSPATDINDIHSLQPVVNPAADRYYILDLVSGFGCGTSSDTVFVKVFNGIFVPNAFTPNGDNINDTWNIPGLEACEFFEVKVFNRWGQLVFQRANKWTAWDGTWKGSSLPGGVYIYIIKACNTPEVLKGTVLLIR